LIVACASSADSPILHVSNNFGNNWIIVDIGEDDLVNISLSASGQYQTAISSDFVFTSSDYGNTWVKSTNQVLNSNSSFFNCVSLSSSGQYQTVLTRDGDIYTCISSLV